MIYPLLLRVTLEGAISAVSGVLTDYVMVTVLLVIAIYFTFATRGVQFRMIGEMCRLLIRSGKRDNDTRKTDEPHHGTISSFQAFALSIASRVGTGNMAGVATAIASVVLARCFGCGSLPWWEHQVHLLNRLLPSSLRSRGINRLWEDLLIIYRKVSIAVGGQ